MPQATELYGENSQGELEGVAVTNRAVHVVPVVVGDQAIAQLSGTNTTEHKVDLPALTQTAWAASTAYSVGDIIFDSTTGTYQVCVTAGTSGASAPAFSTVEGVVITDNTCAWTPYKDIFLRPYYVRLTVNADDDAAAATKLVNTYPDCNTLLLNTGAIVSAKQQIKSLAAVFVGHETQASSNIIAVNELNLSTVQTALLFFDFSANPANVVGVSAYLSKTTAVLAVYGGK